MINEKELIGLYNKTKKMYNDLLDDLPFHGWSHVNFVFSFSQEFSIDLKANKVLVGIASLAHDFNHLQNLVKQDTRSILLNLIDGFDFDYSLLNKIEDIIEQAKTRNRNNSISQEAKALSDADTLYKSLPITPILFAKHFLQEKKITLKELSEYILKSQQPHYENDIYFYSEAAKKYITWAKTNLQLWNNVLEFYNDKRMNDHFLFRL